MKLILRGDGGQSVPLTSAIDLDTLELDVKIPAWDTWLQFASPFTRAPEPLLVDCYLKRASFLDYAPLQTGLGRSQGLRKNPHPNIAKYLGCTEINDRIRSLCFGRYMMTLQERAETGIPLDTNLCPQALKDARPRPHSQRHQYTQYHDRCR
ncbi:hypothetical protein V8C42DRAFT_149411 [Trichoderma barbatum]